VVDHLSEDGVRVIQVREREDKDKVEGARASSRFADGRNGGCMAAGNRSIMRRRCCLHS
jgi:hypothetical protein